MNSTSLDALGSTFADTAAEIVSKISGLRLSLISSEPDDCFDGVVGSMNLLDKNSQSSLTLFISSNEADMRVICSYMTGVPKDGVTKEDVDDALCEIVNMTAGNVKLRLGADYMFTPSAPFAIKGENMSLVTKKRASVISKRLGDGEISLKLKVIYTGR